MLAIFGPIQQPLDRYGDVADANLGIIYFLSNFIKLIAVVAGIYAFINIIVAGFQYINSGGDTKLTQAAWARINMSLIGLVVIVGSFLVAGIAGQLLFGSWDAILNPQIYGPSRGAPRSTP